MNCTESTNFNSLTVQVQPDTSLPTCASHNESNDQSTAPDIITPASETVSRSETTIAPAEVGVAVGGASGGVVEESGPVEYSDGEEEEGGGLRDADMDELAYEGDPLLYSDCEEGE